MWRYFPLVYVVLHYVCKQVRQGTQFLAPEREELLHPPLLIGGVPKRPPAPIIGRPHGRINAMGSIVKHAASPRSIRACGKSSPCGGLCGSRCRHRHGSIPHPPPNVRHVRWHSSWAHNMWGIVCRGCVVAKGYIRTAAYFGMLAMFTGVTRTGICRNRRRRGVKLFQTL